MTAGTTAGTAGTAALAEVVIDSMEFARDGRRLAGEIPVSRLERLADVLADTAGSLRVELAGTIDGEGNPCLRLKVAGSLNLRCQRCLEPMAWSLAIDSVLHLTDDVRMEDVGGGGDEEELDADAPDVIVADKELAVLPLVEDEALLSLPIAPRHERCTPPSGGEKDRAPSPFAVLAQLKKH